MDDAIPITQWFVRVLKDSPGDMGKAIAVWSALFALPMPLTGGEIIDGRVSAAWATDAIWPAARDQVSLASLFVGEHFLELSDGQLMDGLGLFGAGHDGFSTMEKTVMPKVVCQVPDNRPS
jgi:hypothetical protein